MTDLACLSSISPLILLVGLSLAAGCGEGCHPGGRPDPETGGSGVDSAVVDGRRVIVLVMDGVRLEESFGDGYSDLLASETEAVLPTIRSDLLSAGALVEGAYAAGITITAPGHVDMLTGVRQTFANYPVDSGAGAYLPEYPTLLSLLPAGQSLLVTNSALVTPLIDSLSPLDIAPAELIFQEAQPDLWVIETLKEVLPGSAYRLVVVNLHEADAKGHYGEDGEYGEAVRDLDEFIPHLWAQLQQLPDWQDRTTLVLVADHGRHRRDVSEAWRSHGDQCGGCREVPMAFVGDGIRPGVVVEEPSTLEDVAQTIAWLLDIPLPYGSGQVIAEALTDPPTSALVQGALEPTAAGGLRAWEERTGDRAQRAVVSLEGEVVSREDAVIAEAPRLVVGADGVAALCWRELFVGGADEDWPWKAACRIRRSTGEWQDIPAPVEQVWPLWRPALALDGLDLWAAWVDNATGEAAPLESALILSCRGAERIWQPITVAEGDSFYADPALALGGSGELFVAIAAGAGERESRHNRLIDLYAVSAETEVSTRLVRLTPRNAAVSGVTTSADRLEHPALWQGGGEIRLAWVGYTLDGDQARAAITLLRRAVDAEGAVDEPVIIDAAALGHVYPTFDAAGTLYWARMADSGEVEICRWSEAQPDAACQTTGVPYIRGLAVDGETILFGARGEDGVWRLQAL